MQKPNVRAILIVAMCLCGAVSATRAQGKGKPAPSPVPVTSQVHDFNGPDALAVQSDGVESYGNGSAVVSQIYSGNGDWELDLSAQTVRTVHLTFDPAPGSPAAPVASANYNARMISRCFNSEGAITGFLLIGEGQVNDRCSLRVNFSAGGTQYFLVMSPLYAGTGWATVSCAADADSNTTCENWTIVPGSGVNANIGSLYSIGRAGKEVFVGSYFDTFLINVAR